MLQTDNTNNPLLIKGGREICILATNAAARSQTLSTETAVKFISMEHGRTRELSVPPQFDYFILGGRGGMCHLSPSDTGEGGTGASASFRNSHQKDPLFMNQALTCPGQGSLLPGTHHVCWGTEAVPKETRCLRQWHWACRGDNTGPGMQRGHLANTNLGQSQQTAGCAVTFPWLGRHFQNLRLCVHN